MPAFEKDNLPPTDSGVWGQCLHTTADWAYWPFNKISIFKSSLIVFKIKNSIKQKLHLSCWVLNISRKLSTWNMQSFCCCFSFFFANDEDDDDVVLIVTKLLREVAQNNNHAIWLVSKFAYRIAFVAELMKCNLLVSFCGCHNILRKIFQGN